MLKGRFKTHHLSRESRRRRQPFSVQTESAVVSQAYYRTKQKTRELMHSGSSFRYDKTLSSDTNANIDGRDDSDFRENRNNLFEIQRLPQKHKTKGTTIFF